MTTRVLISFFCDDRPGVIEQLSQAVEAAEGNWLDSQLSRLGGRFAGVLQVEAPGAQQAALGAAQGRGIHRGAGLIRVIRPPGPAHPAGELAHQHQGGGQGGKRGA